MFKHKTMIAAPIFVILTIAYSTPMQADPATTRGKGTEAKFINLHGNKIKGLNKKEVDDSRRAAMAFAIKSSGGRNSSRADIYYAVLYSELHEKIDWVFNFPLEPMPKRSRHPCWEQRTNSWDKKYWRWKVECVD